jgi:organic hydroperoxide reductase OsmC/OhrA
MAEYKATIEWTRDGANFVDKQYSRAHRWSFDGGITVPASSSPHHVRLPFSVEAAVDPEEAFVASLSSCHMLSFLWIAARQGFLIDAYRDEAAGIMAKDGDGRLAVTRVTLRPDVRWGGEKRPSTEELDAMHHQAHEDCFIARSVKTEVRVEPAGSTA